MKAHQLNIPVLPLEGGGDLKDVVLHYRVKGDIVNEPVVWVFHALTANDDPTDWWPGLFGPEGLFGSPATSAAFTWLVWMPSKNSGACPPVLRLCNVFSMFVS